MSREQNLIADLDYIEDVLKGNRSYSPINFKDSEFRRIMGDVVDRMGTLEEKETKEDTKRKLKHCISNALEAIDELNYVEELIDDL